MKDIAKQVLDKYNGCCKICGSHNMVQLHHIVSGNGRRTQHQNIHSVIPLCWVHHHSTTGVHGRDGRELDLALKKELQHKYKNMGFKENEIRDMMGGKLY